MMDYNEQYKALWRAAGKHPKPAADWNRRAAEMHPEPFLENTYTRTFLEKVNTEGCESVLDLGCGVGNLLIPLTARLKRGWGVDFASAMLEEARKNAEAYGRRNLGWIPADWRDESVALPQADLVLASRSLDAEDMLSALKRLDALARRRVCLTYRAGRSYLDEALLDALGRAVPPRPAPELLLNILSAHLGIEARLDFIRTEKISRYADAEALKQRVCWTLGALSDEESQRLARFFKTLPVGEGGARVHAHEIVWAFIGWEASRAVS